MDINLKVNRRIDMEDLNVILKAKKYELEYCIVQVDSLKEDILSLKGEIYEIEQIQSSNT
jgi:hypothetical protein|tara:strand:- start:254 stop:433 length:180 start_codon:yes stop_codon:yes gene_type:complete